jgi:hypothetical protein
MSLRCCVVAAVLFAGGAASSQEPAPEPPYRVEVERVTFEKRAGRPTLAVRATTDLPAQTVVDVTLSALVPVYDEALKAIVRSPAGSPIVRKLRVQPAGRGKGEISATQPFPREGEIRVEVSFNPELLFEEERAPIRKIMGEKFVRMRWERIVLLGTPASRLGAMPSRYGADLAWVSEAERLVRKLGQLSKGTNADAITNVCSDLNETMAKIEKAEVDSPFPATLGHLRAVLGRVAAWGAYRVALTARATEGADEDAASADGGGGKPDGKRENDLASYREDVFLGSLVLVRDLAVREFALAGAGEVLRAGQEIAAALRAGGWPDDRTLAALRGAAEAVQHAVRKHHDTGLSKLGDAYGALFAAQKGAKDVLEAALARLDQAAGVLSAAAPAPAQVSAFAEALAQDLKALGALAEGWRRLER